MRMCRIGTWFGWLGVMKWTHFTMVMLTRLLLKFCQHDTLLVKLMDQTGPVNYQLSSEVGNEVLHAVAQFLLDENVFDICLSWLQQLLDMIVENGTDNAEIPVEVKKGDFGESE